MTNVFGWFGCVMMFVGLVCAALMPKILWVSGVGTAITLLCSYFGKEN